MKKSCFALFFVFLLAKAYSQKSDSLTIGNEVFTKVDESASFPGGDEGFYQFLSQNLKYPIPARRAGIQGRVHIQFIVEKDGSITNAKIVKGIGGGCDEEALRVIELMPNWIPGRQKGQKVRQIMLRNISFRLSGGANNSDFNGYSVLSGDFDPDHFDRPIELGKIEFDSTYFSFIAKDDTAKYFARPSEGYINFMKSYKDAILNDASYKPIDTEISISFDVSETGELNSFMLSSELHPNDTSAVRALMQSPKWKPANKSGMPAKQRMIINLVSFFGPVYDEVDVSAIPPDNALDFLRRNTVYPLKAMKEGIQGDVLVEFIVEKNGKLSNAKVVSGIGGGCDEEAIRVINLMPEWSPAFHKNQTVRQRVVKSVSFFK